MIEPEGRARSQGEAGIVVRRWDIQSPPARSLIGALDAELTSRYPEEGATHFR